METQQSDHSAKMMKRYKDAYLVARTTIGIAGTIKTLGFVFGGIIALIGFSVGSQGHGNPVFQYGGLILGVVIAIPLFVLGVLIAAQGQVLKATLDEAVHTSPFLTNDQRAAIMFFSSSSASPEAIGADTSEPTMCPNCSKAIPAGEYCHECGWGYKSNDNEPSA